VTPPGIDPGTVRLVEDSMYKNNFAKVLNITRGEKGKMKKKWRQGRGREEENTQQGTEIKTDRHKI